MNEAEEIKTDVLFKFNSGLQLYLQGMILSRKLFNEEVVKKNRNKAFIHFYHFLCDMFALRENLNINDKLDKGKKEETVFGALKNYYECIKHKNNYKKVQDINLLVGNASYPKQYPFCYGNSHIIFKKMDKEISDLKRCKPEEKERVLELHKKYLENKDVDQILLYCIQENEILLAKDGGINEE